MSALVDLWSNETKKQSQKDQSLSGLNDSAASSTGVGSASSTSGGMNPATLLAHVFGQVSSVESLLTHSSEASVSMLVEWFSP